MSVSSLPEWKQLLLDRKRKGEEARERQERVEERRLANMPAWKREIIQRRRAKQEGDGGHQTVDGGASAESECEAVLGKWFWSGSAQGIRNGAEPQSQVSAENIGPIRHNPLIRSQGACRSDRGECWEELGPDSRAESAGGVRRVGEGDPWRKEEEQEEGPGRWGYQRAQDIDCEGEKHLSVKCKREGNGGDWGESEKPREGERGRHCLRRKEGVDRGGKDPATGHPVHPLPAPGLGTVQAENVITTESEVSSTEKEALSNKMREEEMEAGQEIMKEGRTMNLRSTVEAGGDAAEMKASEVLVMKPAAGAKDRSEARWPLYCKREGRRPGTGANEERHGIEEVIYTLGEREEAPGGDKARSRMKVGRIWPKLQARTGEKEAEADRSMGEDMEGGASLECLGRVSQLRSKFGEQHKPPLRSKSTDRFASRDRGGGRGNVEEESTLGERETWTQEEEETEEVKSTTVKGVPVRAFICSERVVSDMENRADDEDYAERTVVELRCWESREAKGDEREHGEMLHQSHSQLSMPLGPSMPRKAGVGGEGVSKRGGMGKAPEDSEMTLSYNEERKDGEMGRLRSGASPRLLRESEMAYRKGEEQAAAVRRNEQPQRNITEVLEKQRQDVLGEERPTNESLFTECTGSDHAESKRPTCHMDHNSCLPEGRSREKKTESGEGGACFPPTHGPFHGDGKADMDEALSWSHTDGENTKRVLERNRDKAVASVMDSGKPTCATATGEIVIPRTHFYMRGGGSKLCVERQERRDRGKESESQWREGWEDGQPLICFESLQEVIGQKGVDRVMEGEVESRTGLGSRWEEQVRPEEDIQGKERKREENGRMEVEREPQMREVVDKRQPSREGKETVILAGSERVGKMQRGPCLCSSSSLSVIQEAGMPKPGPQLPACVSLSQLPLAAEAEAKATSAATPVAIPLLHSRQRREQERQHVEDSERGQKGRRFTEEGGKEEKEESPGEGYHPQSPSSSPTTSIDVSPPPFSTLPSAANMSRIYNQKPVVPRSPLSIGERKTEKMSPTLKAQGRESPLQSHRSPQTQDNLQHKGETQERQSLPRVELKPTWWQACQQKPKEETNSRGLEVQTEIVQQQVELLIVEAKPQAPSEASNQQELLKGCLGLKESSKPLQLWQQYQKVDQRTFPKDQETSNEKKPTQQLSKQKPPLKKQPPNQCQQSRSFTVNPKSSPVLENPPQIQECKDAITPSSSLSPSPSTSPFILPNAPLFSLRSASAGPGKRGNTITIVPKRTPAGGKPSNDPGANRAAPQTQTSISGDTSKKRYPTVEEIVVIGGYQKLEKSCLSKPRKTPKGVTVCFDEAQLEQVCEYPSEGAVLASLPADSEREAEEKTGGQEEEEEEEEETGAFALGGERTGAGKGRVLRVDESCRR